VPLAGLDANGLPNYDFSKLRSIRFTSDTGTTMISPYDLKTRENVGI
jgi:hypothetical protein